MHAIIIPKQDIVATGAKYRSIKPVPDFTSERKERQKVQVHSCIRDLDSIGVGL